MLGKANPFCAQFVTNPTYGCATLNADGRFVYTSDTHFVGSDSFAFTFSDPLGPGNTATVSIDVYNNAPVATDASYSVLHDTTLTDQVYGYDQDGDAITAHLVSGPTNGTVSLNSEGTVSLKAESTVNLNADGTFVYTPSAGYVGSDSFTFTFSDALGPGNTATVLIDVYNNAPVATDASYRILDDTTLTGEVYDCDQDGNAITAELVCPTTNRETTAQLVTNATHGRFKLNPDGTFSALVQPSRTRTLEGSISTRMVLLAPCSPGVQRELPRLCLVSDCREIG